MWTEYWKSSFVNKLAQIPICKRVEILEYHTARESVF